VRITDINGNVVNKYEYDDFGNIISQTESISNDYTYTGKERDRDSGLYYFGARYYDPEIGRWLTKDPKLGRISALRYFLVGQKLNRYSYVLNNPVNFIDMWGLEEKTKLQEDLEDLKEKLKDLYFEVEDFFYISDFEDLFNEMEDVKDKIEDIRGELNEIREDIEEEMGLPEDVDIYFDIDEIPGISENWRIEIGVEIRF